MIRFFVNPQEMESDYIILSGDNAAHAKVLRLKTGEQVLVCDGQGKECLCTATEINSSQISLVVNSRHESNAEPTVKVSVYMAFAKGDKFEHVIQKATELGAYEIIAFPSARCVSKPDKKSISKKIERWQKIAAAASEQAGRGIIPQVKVVKSYADAINSAAKNELGILFYENEHSTTLQMKLTDRSYSTISLLTGPEGGLEEREVQQAIDAGLCVCTLGKRILRCETAPLCALSAVMYQAGEF